MPDPFSRPFSSPSPSQDSLLYRIRDNFHQFLAPPRVFPSSANGAPIHLPRWERSPRSGRAQSVSLLTHAAIITALALIAVQPRRPAGGGPETPPHGPFTFFHAPDDSGFGQPSLGKKGGGGEEDSRPTRHGLLAPGSSMPILPPRKIINTTPELPVLSSVFDPNAPQFPAPVTNLGLPWMKNDSDSAGPGKNHGFGAGKKGGMGDDEGPDTGEGESYNGPYANVVSRPTCAYCPDPQYTDEAREAKVQGKVTLRVLVNVDGRAAQIRIVQGIGLGLDERAAEAVRGWKFVPARDAGRRAVATWVTIEAVFRLF
jgi:protein TonB